MLPDDSIFVYTVTNRAPDYQVADTEVGTMYAAHREGGPEQTYWRFANFMLPVLDPDAAGQVRERTCITARGSRWTTPTRCS